MYRVSSIKYRFLFLFCLLSAITSVFAQVAPAAQSEYLYTLLEDKGFSPVKQALVPADDNCFPVSIYTTITATPAENSELVKKTNRNTVVFAFTEQFAVANKDNLCNFIGKIKEKKLPYTTVILLSADDEVLPLDTPTDYHSGGTAIFTAEIDNPDSYCAIVVEQYTNDRYEIVPGGGGDTSPSWLVQSLRHGCALCGEDSDVSSSFISFYRNGILRENSRVSSFLAEEIPAASITLDGSQKDFDILCATADTLSTMRSDRWDRHYSFLPLGSEGVLLSESFYASSFLLFGLVSLFLLCFLSFACSSEKKAQTKDVLSIWYIVPIIIILTATVLFLTELPFPSYSSKVGVTGMPVLIFGLKLTLTMFITTISFILQIHYSYRIAPSAYGFFMVTIAVANIFIFTAVDISLIYLFFFEYLLVLLANKVKSLPLLILTFFLMLMPFFPYVMDLLKFASFEGLYHLVKNGFRSNVLLALILFPFQVQLLRIFIALDFFGKEKYDSTSVIFKRALFTTIISLSIVSTGYFLFSRIMMNSNSLSQQTKKLVLKQSAASDDIRASVEETSFMELTARHLLVSSSKHVLRYIICITTPSSVPLYDCNYNYTLAGEHTAYFNLPDYPSGPLEIIYSTDPHGASNVKIEAYIMNDDGSVTVETKTVEPKVVE